MRAAADRTLQLYVIEGLEVLKQHPVLLITQACEHGTITDDSALSSVPCTQAVSTSDLCPPAAHC
jgi:hypothetical protein